VHALCAADWAGLLISRADWPVFEVIADDVYAIRYSGYHPLRFGNRFEHHQFTTDGNLVQQVNFFGVLDASNVFGLRQAVEPVDQRWA
jgi:hypothetical protein